jgi:general secretion pathway protein G
MAYLTTSGSGVRGRANGFTLIELLVVFAILATLLTLAVPRYFASVDRSKEAVLKQNLATLRNALDQFHSDTGKYPESLDDLVKKRYLRTVPLDPITERTDSWVAQAPPADSGATGIYDVRSGAEGKAADGTDYASW